MNLSANTLLAKVRMEEEKISVVHPDLVESGPFGSSRIRKIFSDLFSKKKSVGIILQILI